MLKREALEILGMERRRRPARRVRRACSTSASTCSRCTSAASCKTDFAPLPRDRHLPRAVPAAGPRDRQAGARPDGADPRAAGRSRTTRPAAASPGPTGSSARSTTSRWRSARACSRQIADARPDRAVCDSETCRWQIEQATGVRTRAPGRDAPPRRRPRLTPWSASSSSPTARGWPTGVVELAREMGGERGGDRAGRRDGRRRDRHRRRARAGGDRARPLARRRARADGPRQRADERRDGGRDGRAGRRAGRALGGAAGRGRRRRGGPRARAARRSTRSPREARARAAR